ncbi:hypothetical protein [Catenovulum adriaticum]|uniref:Transposase n=1 Tax=Catenovulum adriaticum TaxID=2984846 RepID=A0ABY7AR30_9ALTE|nr:hypothetical protein [Catenovulum sp. TS8]WAJ71708.1 hypothetical protein OLW01_15315 [Catenovulum sp. TS8]
MADTPETSDFTSIQERLGIAPAIPNIEQETTQAKQTQVDSKQSNSKVTHPLNPVRNAELLPFVKSNQELAPNFKRDASHIPFSLIDYVQLVDWTSRQIRQDKRGFIQSNIPSIVQRLGLTDESWLEFASSIETNFSHSIGQAVQLQHYAKAHQLKRVKGITKTKQRLQT